MSRDSAKLHAREANEVLENARREGREPSTAERVYVEQLLDRAKSEAGLSARYLGSSLDAIDGCMGPVSQGGRQFFADPGEAFVKSDGYRRIKDGNRPAQWSTGMIDTNTIGVGMKGTLLEGAGNPGAGTGGGLVPVPQVVPGTVGKLFQRLTFEDLLLGGQTATSTVRYAVEGTALSAAAGVAEGGTKPESTLAYSTTDEPVKKVATVVAVSDELLSDAPAVQSFISGRLAMFVQIEVERELIRGTAGGNEVQGLLTSRSVPVYAGGTAAGNRAVQVFKAMNGMRGSAFVEPDWVVMNPADWEIIRLSTDTAGQYLGGGPMGYSYGGAVSVDASGQVTGSNDNLWGKAVYVTSAIGAGTAIIGTESGAQVFSRGGLSVEASNSHSTFFVQDLVALRAERRLALCVYRSNAYCEVRLA